MFSVSQVSKIAGVSIRTLHYYDSEGILKPSMITEAGYRFYDDDAIKKLHVIMVFRQLQFSIKEIKAILNNPSFDLNEALTRQIEMLKLQRDQINAQISMAYELRDKGGIMMKANDSSDKLNELKEEARKRWGETEAYREFEEKTKDSSAQSMDEKGKQLMAIFTEIGTLKELPCDSEQVQDSVEKVRNYISENFYACSKEIFASLGQMYVADERMKNNIDEVGGAGTAEFVSKAIEIYCRNK